MSKNTTAAAKIKEKIAAAIAATSNLVVARFYIDDESVQAEQRLRCQWRISYRVDHIEAKRDLANSSESKSIWAQFSSISEKISTAASGFIKSDRIVSPVSLRKKGGEIIRAEDLATFTLNNGREFLSALKKATTKNAVAAVTTKVASLQAEQKALLPAMRKSNAAYLSDRKNAKSAEREADSAAIASGEFWNATPAAIKDYFHPPFEKNHFADVSSRWRAALFLECESTGWKDNSGNYRHKLVGTGRAYLCGIDDNGDEWGHDIRLELDHDHHGNRSLDATVEQAMAEVFGVSFKSLANCTRQGDLLFRPCSIRTTTEVVCANCGCKESQHIEYNMYEDLGQNYTEKFCWYVGGDTYRERVLTPPVLIAESSWTVRESHRIVSPSLRHNGRFFSAADDITVEHTSHQPVVLPAGEYCLHALQIADAD